MGTCQPQPCPPTLKRLVFLPKKWISEGTHFLESLINLHHPRSRSCSKLVILTISTSPLSILFGERGGRCWNSESSSQRGLTSKSVKQILLLTSALEFRGELPNLYRFYLYQIYLYHHTHFFLPRATKADPQIESLRFVGTYGMILPALFFMSICFLPALRMAPFSFTRGLFSFGKVPEPCALYEILLLFWIMM